MKKLSIFAAAVLMSLGLNAQNIQETVIAIDNLTVPAVTLSTDKDIKMVQDAMNQYLKEAKLKTEKSGGFTIAFNANIPTIASAPVHLYTRVETQGKGKNKTTLVTIATICTDLTIEPGILRSNTRSWLEDFYPFMGRYEASLQMAVEQQNLKRAEKVADKAVSEMNSIEKSIADKQEKINDKKKEIAKLNERIKQCEQDIKKLESDIQQLNKAKGNAEEKVQSANQNVNNVQGEVEKYRQMAE